MHFQHQKLAALQGKSPNMGEKTPPPPSMGSATAGMHGERAGVLGMSPGGSWHCRVFFLFQKSPPPSALLLG